MSNSSIIVLTENFVRISPCRRISYHLFLLAETNFKSRLVRNKKITDHHPAQKLLFAYKANSPTL